MKKLSDEKIVEIRELTKAGASVRITSALTGASIGSISHYTDDIDKSPHVRKQSYIQPVKRQMAKAVPVYTRRQPSSYIDQVRIAPPSGRMLLPEKPVAPEKPSTKIQKERKNFKDRKWIDVSWVEKENERRHVLNRKNQHERERDAKRVEYDRQHDQMKREIEEILIQKKQARDRKQFELDYSTDSNNKLTEKGIRSAIQEVVKVDKEQQHKICRAYGELCDIQNGEVYRVKKKKINDKFIADIMPAGWTFLNDILKSIQIIRSISPKKTHVKVIPAKIISYEQQPKLLKQAVK